MKVYVVESGWYSDCGIDFVTDDEETAKKYCELHQFDYGEPRYTEFDTSQVSIQTIDGDEAVPWIVFGCDNKQGIRQVKNDVWYKSSNEPCPVPQVIESYETCMYKGIGIVVVGYNGNDIQDQRTAIRVARDMWAQWLAEKNGL